MRFEDFKVGDHVWFEKMFRPDDFALFSRLSGDNNPLHGDPGVAKSSKFGQTIVPLHMVAAPMSRIAGMIFPGEPSLYLGSQWRMPQPAYFDVPITYSARIRAISPAQRLLEIRVLAFQDRRVVLDGSQHVNARVDEWTLAPELAIHCESECKRVLLTGAAGEIGRAIALCLSRAGFDLVLHARTTDVRIENLKRECQQHTINVETVAADLATEKGRFSLVKSISGMEVNSVVHAASPGVEASVHELADVNFTALEAVANAAIPNMLRRQNGTLIFIGSVAVETHPPGWASYVGAKSMGTSFVDGFDRAYSAYGIYGRVLAPGYVNTAMSKKLRPPDAETILPEEVADTVAKILSQPMEARPYISMRVGDVRGGQFGFTPRDTRRAGTREEHEEPSGARDRPTRLNMSVSASGDLLTFVASFLNIGDATAVRDGGLEMTPGWDSLRHIELMLAVEQKFGFHLSAGEIEKAKTYRDLENLVRTKSA